jgi:hypothetical protein
VFLREKLTKLCRGHVIWRSPNIVLCTATDISRDKDMIITWESGIGIVYALYCGNMMGRKGKGGSRRENDNVRGNAMDDGDI